VTIDATIASGGSGTNLRMMEVIPGERKGEMAGIDGTSILEKVRTFRFGRRVSFAVRYCRIERAPGDRTSRMLGSPSFQTSRGKT